MKYLILPWGWQLLLLLAVATFGSVPGADCVAYTTAAHLLSSAGIGKDVLGRYSSPNAVQLPAGVISLTSNKGFLPQVASLCSMNLTGSASRATELDVSGACIYASAWRASVFKLAPGGQHMLCCCCANTASPPVVRNTPAAFPSHGPCYQHPCIHVCAQDVLSSCRTWC